MVHSTLLSKFLVLPKYSDLRYFRINVGKDAAGKHYHESNLYQNAKTGSTWADWNTHVHGAGNVSVYDMVLLVH